MDGSPWLVLRCRARLFVADLYMNFPPDPVEKACLADDIGETRAR